MITKEELRRLMEAEGFTQEEIDDACERHFRAELDMEAAAAAWAEMMETINQAFARTKEICEEILRLATMPRPKKKPPRPPRCDGPQNKGRSWNRQPHKQARSSCRKMRR